MTRSWVPSIMVTVPRCVAMHSCHPMPTTLAGLSRSTRSANRLLTPDINVLDPVSYIAFSENGPNPLAEYRHRFR